MQTAAPMAAKLGTAVGVARALLPTSVVDCESIIIEEIRSLRYEGAEEGIVWDAARRLSGFMDLGVDSLDAVRLVQNVNVRLGLSLGNSILFEHPSVRELAAFVHEQLQGQPARPLSRSSDPSSKLQEQRRLFLAGATSRWPCNGTSDFELSPSGGDALRQIPSARWNISSHAESAAHFGSFVLHAELFDSPFFGMSQAEVIATDPQQRLLLEYGYASMHSAQERRETLRASDVGIFLGIMNTDFNAVYLTETSVYAATGGTISVAAGRLSFVLGTQGPCASYDTACSSALVASHGASSALRSSECTSSLVLSASLMLSPQARVALKRLEQRIVPFLIILD